MNLVSAFRRDWVGLVLALVPVLVFLVVSFYIDPIKQLIAYPIARLALAIGICSALIGLGIAAANMVHHRITLVRGLTVVGSIGFLVWSVPYGIGVLEALRLGS